MYFRSTKCCSKHARCLVKVTILNIQDANAPARIDVPHVCRNIAPIGLSAAPTVQPDTLVASQLYAFTVKRGRLVGSKDS